MWTIFLQRPVAGRVLLTKGLNTTWLLALEGLGGGPVCWRDNLATHDPDSSPGEEWFIRLCSHQTTFLWLKISHGETELSGVKTGARQAASLCETLASWPPYKWTFQTLQAAHAQWTHTFRHTFPTGHIHRNVHVVMISLFYTYWFTHTQSQDKDLMSWPWLSLNPTTKGYGESVLPTVWLFSVGCLRWVFNSFQLNYGLMYWKEVHLWYCLNLHSQQHDLLKLMI